MKVDKIIESPYSNPIFGMLDRIINVSKNRLIESHAE
jgi:hypothetical protein